MASERPRIEFLLCSEASSASSFFSAEFISHGCYEDKMKKGDSCMLV